MAVGLLEGILGAAGSAVAVPVRVGETILGLVGVALLHAAISRHRTAAAGNLRIMTGGLGR